MWVATAMLSPISVVTYVSYFLENKGCGLPPQLLAILCGICFLCRQIALPLSPSVCLSHSLSLVLPLNVLGVAPCGVMGWCVVYGGVL